MCAFISRVFDYINPVRKNEIGQRAFVERVEYENRVRNALGAPGLLVISGYSGIGKSTVVAQALDLDRMRGRVAYYEPPVRVFGTALERVENPFQAIYQAIESRLGPSRIPEDEIEYLHEERIAELLHLSRSVFVLENFHNLSVATGHQLHTMFKAWSEWMPTSGPGNILRSKIVLISPVPRIVADEWLTNVATAPGVPLRHITILPWSPDDLREILHNGANLLNITYHPIVEDGLINLSCGIPRALTALANLTATAANEFEDEVYAHSFQVNLDHLERILGSYNDFKDAILFEAPTLPDNPVEQIVVSYLGVNGGEVDEENLFTWCRDNNIDIYDQSKIIKEDLSRLLTVTEAASNQPPLWLLNELAYGALAFVKLYLQKVLPHTPPHMKSIIDSLLKYHSCTIASQPENADNPSDHFSKPDRSQIFISYSRSDQRFHDELRNFLGVVEDRFEIWSDKDIEVGENWRQAIESALNRARVGILLVSPNFLNSRFIQEDELPPLLRAAEEDECRIVWVAVDYSLVDQTDLIRYQAANDPRKPLASLTKPQRAREISKVGRLILDLFNSDLE